jgi:adenylate cyclase
MPPARSGVRVGGTEEVPISEALAHPQAATAGRTQSVWPGLAIVAGAAIFVLVLARPALDGTWENHAAHFWLVLVAAALNVALGYTVGAAARRRRDARLFLVALAFVSAAGFLGLHALATPGVLIGKNAGFELATPVGLALAGAFAAASGLPLKPPAAQRVLRWARPLAAALALVMATWAFLSLAEIGPLADLLLGEELDGWQISLAAFGFVLYTAAAIGYFRLYLRRRAAFLLVVTLAFGLLAEAMFVIAWARNWRVSWWEWHLLMVGAFLAIAASAKAEWHEERFSPLYLDETLAGSRDVSIMFADLQGFTPFAERTSPARVASMLNGYFATLVPLLQRAGGNVHQIIGDAVMVIWNEHGNQPDHPERAARAALEFQEAAGRLADDHAEWPRFRVGLNSGEVLSGVVGGATGHRKHGVVGDTVNLAARLEGQAAAGQVVLGAGTAEALPPGAVIERLPPLDVKGKGEPVDAYVLHRLQPA